MLETFPDINKIIKSPEVSILVVALHPGTLMVNTHSLWQGNGLPKVNHVNTV